MKDAKVEWLKLTSEESLLFLGLQRLCWNIDAVAAGLVARKLLELNQTDSESLGDTHLKPDRDASALLMRYALRQSLVQTLIAAANIPKTGATP